jgi:hypothetical protein
MMPFFISKKELDILEAKDLGQNRMLMKQELKLKAIQYI